MQLDRTVAVPLRTTPSDAAALVALRPLVTGAYNDAVAYAWTHDTKDTTALHHAVYRDLRARYGLPSQFVCNTQRLAMGSVAALRKRRAEREREIKKDGKTKKKPISCPYSDQIPIPYDVRSMALRLDRKIVSLATLGKRIEVPLQRHKHLSRYKDWHVDSGRVRQRHDGSWEILLTFTKDVTDVVPNTQNVVGCDRGIVNPAVLSTGKFLGDPRWHSKDRQYLNTTRSLQRKGTKSAKRRLKKRSGKWNRFRVWCDHNVTRQILDSMPAGSVLALEDLTNIRTRMRRFRRDTRRRMHAWSFRRQQEMLMYKAPDVGVLVGYVDARYTSQKCSACGHVSRRSRKSQSRYVCVKCGHAQHADLNAAHNIAANWVVSQQTDDPPVAPNRGHVNPPYVDRAKSRNPKVGRGLRASGFTKTTQPVAKSPGL